MHTAATSPPGESLTPRELDVLRLMAAGLGNQAIAEQLGTKRSTVAHQAQMVIEKLGVNTRVQAVIEAARRKLVRIE